MDELKANGSVTFDFDGEKVVLTEEDLLIDMTQKEGYVTESNQDVTVVLDCNLTPELLEEGFVREIITSQSATRTMQRLRPSSASMQMRFVQMYLQIS